MAKRNQPQWITDSDAYKYYEKQRRDIESGRHSAFFNLLNGAIKEMEACKTKEEAYNIWVKYKSFQDVASFKKIKNQTKLRILKNREVCLEEVRE